MMIRAKSEEARGKRHFHGCAGTGLGVSSHGRSYRGKIECWRVEFDQNLMELLTLEMELLLRNMTMKKLECEHLFQWNFE